MAFTTPQPQRSGPPRNQQQDDLLRLTGLFASKSGKALTGNLDLHARLGEATVGEALLGLIQECMETHMPLRFLVFEREGSTPPYTLNATKGEPRRATGQQPQRWSAPPPPPPAEPDNLGLDDEFPPRDWDETNGTDVNNGPYSDQNAPEPAPPRPTQRRTAPRR